MSALYLMGRRVLTLVSAALLLASVSVSTAVADDNTINIYVTGGKKVTVELLADKAPKHVERVKQLVKDRYYDGVPFHRVIPNFMAQTGDHTGTGRGGSEYPALKAEFTQTPFKRGTVGAARTSNPNSANSQFFICFTDDSCKHLQGQYTVWGQVTDGMEHIDAVTATGQGTADKMEKVRFANEAQS
ncbi:MAG: peptidylprolyl isomerase [Pseudomonadota bacterium]